MCCQSLTYDMLPEYSLMCRIRKRPMKEADKDTLVLAYEMVIPAYDWSLRRVASVEERIDRLIALIVIVTVAFPVAVMALAGEGSISTSALSLTMGSCALALAIFAVGFLIYTRGLGQVLYTLPEAFTREELLSAGAEDFRQEILEKARKSIEDIRALTERRSWRTDWMTGVFGVEVIFGIVWGALQFTG